MKTMTIRGVPEEVHQAVVERARRNRRSLNQQVIAELSGAARGGLDAASKRARAEAMIKAVERVRARLPRFMSAEEIDAAKEEGRD